jgi:alkanesulfonate monooxygenase SsuD/methylene tetrahydromethanopterin reductase-like flavin-dependent oxidoreductase (luciferase family)
MSGLLRGETVTSSGLVAVERARLYTLPVQKPLLIGAALSEETAAWMGGWADGLITVSKPLPELEKVLAAFKANGGAGKPVYLKVQLSYATNEEKALKGGWDQWRTNVLSHDLLAVRNLPNSRMQQNMSNQKTLKKVFISLRIWQRTPAILLLFFPWDLIRLFYIM